MMMVSALAIAQSNQAAKGAIELHLRFHIE